MTICTRVSVVCSEAHTRSSSAPCTEKSSHIFPSDQRYISVAISGMVNTRKLRSLSIRIRSDMIVLFPAHGPPVMTTRCTLPRENSSSSSLES